MGKTKQGGSLGKSLIKDRFKKKTFNEDGTGSGFLHTTQLDDGYDWGRLNLNSVTEQSNLEEFLTTAEMAGTEFTAEKLNVKFVDPETRTGLPTQAEKERTREAQEKHKKLLCIPRRPEWDASTTREELDRKEKDAFLEWRRQLSQLQEHENLVLTPYEKNLDFWRQLWRVIERSDVVVQIVDARNPLLFRSDDLDFYVKETGAHKVNLLLVNKADYLNQTQRQYWANYFQESGIRAVFWSAVNEKKRQEQEAREAKEAELHSHEEMIEEDDEEEDGSDDDVSNDNMVTKETNDDNPMECGETTQLTEDICHTDIKTDNVLTDTASKADSSKVEISPDVTGDDSIDDNSNVKNNSPSETGNISDKPIDASSTASELSQKTVSCSAEGSNTCDHSVKCSSADVAAEVITCPTEILDGPQLLDVFRSLFKGQNFQPGVTTIGMVGYPNVGKSSTINAILRMKKVPVSETPGRTKHFQTLFVDKELMLCDCPGLVFPSFVSTKADLVMNGILPIDQLRDHVPPTSLLTQSISRNTLERVYGILIPKPGEGEDPNRPPTASELLTAYGYMRGFMTPSGNPDCPRSARIILKDYVNGRLVYCNPTPGVSVEDFKPTEGIDTFAAAKEDRYVGTKSSGQDISELDREFFSKNTQKVHSKGVHGLSDHARAEGVKSVGRSEEITPDGSQTSIAGKAWKRHNNRNKKEKVRRVYGYLDKH